MLDLLLAGFLVSTLAHAQPSSPILDGRVVGISDGDTLTLLTGDLKQHKIRLAEIDAPELAQAWGTRSRQNLASACHAKPATVRIVDYDRFERIVGRVHCNGIDANLKQVQDGMAWVYRRYVKDHSLYQIEESARSGNLGLWSDRTPIPPWEWRRMKRQ